MRRPAVLALAVALFAAGAGCGSSQKSQEATPPTVAKPTVTITVQTTTTTSAGPAPSGPTTTESSTGEPPIATTLPPPPPTTTAATTTRPPLAKAPRAVQQTLCPSEQQRGVTANFGNRRTRRGANALLRHAHSLGFQNLVVERRACAVFAVTLRGLRNLAQGRELRAEAATVSLPVTIECRSHPVQGGLAAVFGHRSTRGAAVRLSREAAAVGFQGLQVQQDKCGDWEVDLYGLKTSTQRRDFVAEAASVGFHIRFEPG